VVTPNGTDHSLTPWSSEDEHDADAALLLPGFDEFLLRYRDRSAALDPEHRDRIVPGGNGAFKPTVVADGRVLGTWSRAASKPGMSISIEWLPRMDPVDVT
jgi:hypothetical protein